MGSFFDKGALGTGTGGGILSTVCCSLAMLLVIFGVIGMATAKGIAAYRTYTTIASIFLLVAGTWLMIKRRNNACDINAINREKYAILTVGGTFIVVYLFLVNKGLPYLMKTAKAAAMGG
jgi:hypothetical protein